MRGKLIVLDGPDGSGTTLHSHALAEKLRDQGKDFLLTTEPTDGPIGQYVRVALSSTALPADALQLLFCADRADHVERILGPALEQGKTVVIDRYVASTLAYGQALGLDASWLQELNKNFIQPDHTFFLLPPLSVALERLRIRPTRDRLEDDGLQQRVHEAYQSLAAADPSIVVIDTARDKEAVAEQIWNSVNALL